MLDRYLCAHAGALALFISLAVALALYSELQYDREQRRRAELERSELAELARALEGFATELERAGVELARELESIEGEAT